LPDLWIWLGFLGGAFQAFRIAGQRAISSPTIATRPAPSHWASPFSRVALGVPVAASVLLLTLDRAGITAGELVGSTGVAFYGWITLAAGLQLFATIVQTSLVKRRNFAIGIVYLKIMVPAQALFGVLLFGERFSALQWAALLVVTFGVFVLGRARADGGAGDGGDPGAGVAPAWDWTSLWMGFGAGIVLAFTGLFIREANLALQHDALGPVARGMTSLLVLAALQLATCSIAIAVRDASEFRELIRRYRVVAFTGLMSVCGSACWFVGFALASPALVNAVGQSEFLFAMLLSLFFFRERPTRGEWLGTGVVMSGIVLLLVA